MVIKKYHYEKIMETMSYQNRIQFLICQKFIRHFHNCLQ